MEEDTWKEKWKGGRGMSSRCTQHSLSGDLHGRMGGGRDGMGWDGWAGLQQHPDVAPGLVRRPSVATSASGVVVQLLLRGQYLRGAHHIVGIYGTER